VNATFRCSRGHITLALDLRHFAPSTEALDEAWCSCACTGDVWTPTGHQWASENAPVQVSNAAGTVGVQKPGKVGVSNPHTPATEKIVADLARVIGLPIPPVTLWDRGAGNDPRYVAVSAWAFVSPLTWRQAEPMMIDEQKAALIPAASAMVPFEMWVGATDRQNNGNVLVDGDLAPVRGAWIDDAFSLEHVWKGNLAPATDVAPNVSGRRGGRRCRDEGYC
jgi:hypothetical protein